jgi:hypothetical protein
MYYSIITVKYFHLHIPDLDIWYDHPVESDQCEEIKRSGQRSRKKCYWLSLLCNPLKVHTLSCDTGLQDSCRRQRAIVWDPHNKRTMRSYLLLQWGSSNGAAIERTVSGSQLHSSTRSQVIPSSIRRRGTATRYRGVDKSQASQAL